FYRGAYIAHLLSRLLAGRGSVMQGGNFIVSRSALKAAGGFNSDFQFYGEDAELARRLSKVGIVKFTRALCAFSSGRRFVGEGIFIVLLRYSVNYLWTHFFNHPWSSAWLDFRHTTGASGDLEPVSPGIGSKAGQIPQNSMIAKFGTVLRSGRSG